MSTSIRVGCDLNSQPPTSVKTLCFSSVSVLGCPWSLPWAGLQADLESLLLPQKTADVSSASSPTFPFHPAQPSRGGNKDFLALDFSELCHPCSNQSSCSGLSTHRSCPRWAEPCWAAAGSQEGHTAQHYSHPLPCHQGCASLMGTQPWAAPAEHPSYARGSLQLWPAGIWARFCSWWN